ncbi:MAG TPA: hypothetical protein VK767_15155, partial [Bradyrhizobium sp.]|nr:hypothetical protein [Bradyrhizobium sp.]
MEISPGTRFTARRVVYQLWRHLYRASPGFALVRKFEVNSAAALQLVVAAHTRRRFPAETRPTGLFSKP